jgi:hypothetical protein
MHEPIFAKALWGKATADLRWQAVICNAPFDDATIVHQTVLPRSMPDDPWAVRVVFTTTVTPVTN